MTHLASRTSFALGFAIIALASHVLHAQREPTMIPTVLAKTVVLKSSIFENTPTYVVNRVPAGWPSNLVPAHARIIGGGALPPSSEIAVSVGLFELANARDAKSSMRAMFERAGYKPKLDPGGQKGGFVSSADPSDRALLCLGEEQMASFGPVDTTHATRTWAVYLWKGGAAARNCSSSPDSGPFGRDRVDIPDLVAPPGALNSGSGRSWGTNSGTINSTLHTTMPVDSILMHYTRQLEAAGWKAEPRKAANAYEGIKRYTFLYHGQPWNAALMIIGTADERQMLLQLTREDAH